MIKTGENYAKIITAMSENEAYRRLLSFETTNIIKTALNLDAL